METKKLRQKKKKVKLTKKDEAIIYTFSSSFFSFFLSFNEYQNLIIIIINSMKDKNTRQPFYKIL